MNEMEVNSPIFIPFGWASLVIWTRLIYPSSFHPLFPIADHLNSLTRHFTSLPYSIPQGISEHTLTSFALLRVLLEQGVHHKVSACDLPGLMIVQDRILPTSCDHHPNHHFGCVRNPKTLSSLSELIRDNL